jgi:hypothetical protein
MRVYRRIRGPAQVQDSSSGSDGTWQHAAGCEILVPNGLNVRSIGTHSVSLLMADDAMIRLVILHPSGPPDAEKLNRLVDVGL